MTPGFVKEMWKCEEGNSREIISNELLLDKCYSSIFFFLSKNWFINDMSTFHEFVTHFSK
jgi:hypothetical protein